MLSLNTYNLRWEGTSGSYDMKLKVPNKINYLLLLTNYKKKKKIKQFTGISSSKVNFSIIKQLQDDGTFMLNKKA